MISHSVRMAALVAALLAVPGLQAAEVAGVKLDEQIKVGAGELVLNGAGLRTKVFVKVYVGALYVTQKSNTPAGLLDAATPRRMSMRMLRDIDADTLYGALRDGLKDNNSEAEMAALKAQIDQFADIMKKIGNAKNGDTVAIDFTADGVGVSFNGEARGKVAGAPFARALLKVWLGDNPVDASLKKALLGG
ncbi:MAG: chalcone isomerase family protein [Azonexus sp.]|nr:chalcone isomerase family protein [Azonexus sp.]